MTLKDLDILYEIYSFPELTKYIENLYERSEEEEFTRSYIKNMYQFYGYGLWVICLKDNDRIIGRAGISNRKIDDENSLEIGYLIDTRFQRHGYATEIINGIIQFARERLYATQLRCAIHHENKISINLIEKLGFEFEFETSDTIFFKKKL